MLSCSLTALKSRGWFRSMDHLVSENKSIEMCDKTVYICLFAFNSLPDWYSAQVKSALKLVSNWLVTNRILEKLDDVAFSNVDVVFGDADSNSFTFFSDGIGFNTIDLNNANLDNVNIDEDDPETIIHIRPMACRELRVCNKDIFFLY